METLLYIAIDVVIVMYLGLNCLEIFARSNALSNGVLPHEIMLVYRHDFSYVGCIQTNC